MSNVIKVEFPRKPANHNTRPGPAAYRCASCGEQAQIAVMWVLPEVTCDNCGAEMRPVEMEAK